jgi:hypothetical protein
MGARVAIVTARAYHPQGRSVTEAWLSQHGFDIDELVLTSHSTGKKETLDRLDVVGYLDDYDGHIDALRGTGRCEHVYLCDQPWNRHRLDLPRVRDPVEFVATLAPALACASLGLPHQQRSPVRAWV